MKNLTYLAVFEPSSDNAYSIYFPDLPGCISFGNSLLEAQQMAAEAASLHIYGMEQNGEAIPTPSQSLATEDTEGNVIVPITIYPDLFRQKKDNERVKTNTTLPAWLKRLAETQNVNYSRLLENALLDYLHIPSHPQQHQNANR